MAERPPTEASPDEPSGAPDEPVRPRDPEPTAGGPDAPEPPARARQPRGGDPPEGPLARYPRTSLSIIAVLAAAVIGVLLYIMLRPANSVVSFLADTGYARGLITFLFTLGTIVIALLLAVNAVSRREGDGSTGFKDAKEIFTVLVGILGTIIGFYFGQEAGDTRTQLALTAELAAEEVVELGSTTLTASGVGGRPPYAFEVSAEPDIVSIDETAAEKAGSWTGTITAEEVDGAQDVTIQVKLTDAHGASQSQSLTLAVRDGPAQPEPPIG